jgi:hypothetical protein
MYMYIFLWLVSDAISLIHLRTDHCWHEMKNKLSNCVYALIGGSRKSLECQLNISYFICPLPFPGEKKEIRRQCIIIIHYREITYLYTSPKQVSWQLLAIPSLSSPQFHYACFYFQVRLNDFIWDFSGILSELSVFPSQMLTT